MLDHDFALLFQHFRIHWRYCEDTDPTLSIHLLWRSGLHLLQDQWKNLFELGCAQDGPGSKRHELSGFQLVFWHLRELQWQWVRADFTFNISRVEAQDAGVYYWCKAQNILKQWHSPKLKPPSQEMPRCPPALLSWEQLSTDYSVWEEEVEEQQVAADASAQS